MRLAQLSEFPKNPEHSSSLYARYLCSRDAVGLKAACRPSAIEYLEYKALALVLAYHPLRVTGITIRVRTYPVFLLTQRSVERVPQAFLT